MHHIIDSVSLGLHLDYCAICDRPVEAVLLGDEEIEIAVFGLNDCRCPAV